jgi:hypothetical protein
MGCSPHPDIRKRLIPSRPSVTIGPSKSHLCRDLGRKATGDDKSLQLDVCGGSEFAIGEQWSIEVNSTDM